METCCCPPGDRDPPGGLKVAPTSLLADQFIFPVELASSVRVTIQGDDRPQVPESKLAGLTDQVRIGVGDGDGGNVTGVVGEGVGGVGVGVTGVTRKVTITLAFPPLEVILIVPE